MIIKSMLNWDDPKVFMVCARDPESEIYKALRDSCRTSTAEGILAHINYIVDRDIEAGNPTTGAYYRAIELVQEYLRV